MVAMAPVVVAMVHHKAKGAAMGGAEAATPTTLAPSTAATPATAKSGANFVVEQITL